MRFGNLVRPLEESLQQQLPKDKLRTVLEPVLACTDVRDFRNHALDGLAVLSARGACPGFTGSGGRFPNWLLQRTAATPSPLMRILQSAGCPGG